MNNIYNKMLHAASYNQIDRLKELYYNLLNEKSIMDRFFRVYLEEDNKDFSWKEYKAKFAEYEKLSDNIRVANHLLEKYNVRITK